MVVAGVRIAVPPESVRGVEAKPREWCFRISCGELVRILESGAFFKRFSSLAGREWRKGCA